MALTRYKLRIVISFLQISSRQQTFIISNMWVNIRSLPSICSDSLSKLNIFNQIGKGFPNGTYLSQSLHHNHILRMGIEHNFHPYFRRWLHSRSERRRQRRCRLRRRRRRRSMREPFYPVCAACSFHQCFLRHVRLRLWKELASSGGERWRGGGREGRWRLLHGE